MDQPNVTSAREGRRVRMDLGQGLLVAFMAAGVEAIVARHRRVMGQRPHHAGIMEQKVN